MKEFIKKIDKDLKCVIKDIDEKHIFVRSEKLEVLKQHIHKLIEENSATEDKKIKK